MIPPAGCVHAESKDVCVFGLVSVCRVLCFAKDSVCLNVRASAVVQHQQEALVLVFKVPEHVPCPRLAQMSGNTLTLQILDLPTVRLHINT